MLYQNSCLQTVFMRVRNVGGVHRNYGLLNSACVISAVFMFIFACNTALGVQYGILSGAVTAENGKPIVGATVVVQGTDRGGFTRPDGTFKVIKIKPGTYQIKISGFGYEDLVTSATIKSDYTTRCNVMLSPRSVIITNYCCICPRPMVDAREVGRIRRIGSFELGDY